MLTGPRESDTIRIRKGANGSLLQYGKDIIMKKTIVIYPVSCTGLSRVLVRAGSEVVHEELTQDLTDTVKRLKKQYKTTTVVDIS